MPIRIFNILLRRDKGLLSMNTQSLRAIILLLACVSLHDTRAVQQRKNAICFPDVPDIRITLPNSVKTPVYIISSPDKSPENDTIFKMRTPGTSTGSPDIVTIPRNDKSDSPEVINRRSTESLGSRKNSFSQRDSYKKGIQLYEEAEKQLGELVIPQRDFSQSNVSNQNVPNSLFIPQGKSLNCSLICACFPFLKK